MLRRAAPLALAALAACKSPQPCPSPLEECGGQCVDVQSDRRHCGACERPCRAGESCVGGGCQADILAACPVRLVMEGGAFVTFGACGGTVKLWVQDAAFATEAATYVGSTAPARFPVLQIVPGSDCDEQWSWHVNHLNPSFVTTVAPTGCDVCPSAIQANLTSTPTWCPSQGRARVLAVDP